MSIGDDAVVAPLAGRRSGRSFRAPAWSVPLALIMPSFLLALLIIAYPLYQLSTIAVHEVNRFLITRLPQPFSGRYNDCVDWI